MYEGNSIFLPLFLKKNPQKSLKLFYLIQAHLNAENIDAKSTKNIHS